MATDFKYASQTDLEMYYPAYSQYDSKRHLFGWILTSTPNLYAAHNTGLVTQLYIDGEDMGAANDAVDIPNVNNEWNYVSTADTTYFFHSSTDPREKIMEGGQENVDYFNQMLVNASMELNNLLDRR